MLDRAAEALGAAGVPDARREAEQLAAHLLHTDRGGIALRRRDPLSSASAEELLELARRRARREPYQYVVGEQEFRGLRIAVDPRVLVPRPETEELVEAVLAALPAGARVADLGTGSGCIAVALASARPDLEVTAVDVSAAALALAAENARRNGVIERIRFHHGEWEALPDSWRAAFDVIVSNPPYVTEAEWSGLQPEVRDHEPRIALVSGPTGLEAYATLAAAAARLLTPPGACFVELGHRSAAGAGAAFRRAGFAAIETRPDHRSIERILVARREP